jgi:hypothetical protein
MRAKSHYKAAEKSEAVIGARGGRKEKGGAEERGRLDMSRAKGEES